MMPDTQVNDPSYWFNLPREKVADIVSAMERIHNFTQSKIRLIESAEKKKKANSEPSR